MQTKQFADKDNADLFAEEAAAQREVSIFRRQHANITGGNFYLSLPVFLLGRCIPAMFQHELLSPAVVATLQAERQRLAAIPGMINQPEAQEMNDA